MWRPTEAPVGFPTSFSVWPAAPLHAAFCHIFVSEHDTSKRERSVFLLREAILSPKLGTWAIRSTSLNASKMADLTACTRLGDGGETARAVAARFQPRAARPEFPREEAQNRGSPVSAMTAQSVSLFVFSRLSCRENRECRDGGGHNL